MQNKESRYGIESGVNGSVDCLSFRYDSSYPIELNATIAPIVLADGFWVLFELK
jgi:hypothetical protein